MAFSLYAAVIPSYLQMLAAVSGFLEKAEAHCKEKGVALDTVLQAALAPDMLPFNYQVKATVIHSVTAIEAVRKGVFVPDMAPFIGSFVELKKLITGARATLKRIEPPEIDSLEGRDARFEFGDIRMDFTAEDFLLSFSQPNFYFHVTTAYDILRAKGVQIGKIDYLGGFGELRLKR